MSIVDSCIFFYFFFFFQAEDGIRDVAVTGVQTCALPIFSESLVTLRQHLERVVRRTDHDVEYVSDVARGDVLVKQIAHRSEERRVGKECSLRWTADHEKKYMREANLATQNYTTWRFLI